VEQVSVAFHTWPWLLAALSAAAFILWIARTSNTSLVTWRYWSALLSRLTLVLSLLLALAGFTIVKTQDHLGVFFVVDLSKSISAEDQKFALDWIAQAARGMDAKRDRVGLVVFGADAGIEQPLGPALTNRINVMINRDYTDVSQGIRLAMASFPSDVQRRIVVLTDGEENLGDGLSAAREARAAGIDVWVRTLDSLRGRDVAIEKITIPGEAKVGEAFDVLIHTRFTGAKPGETKHGTLRLFRNRRLLGSFEVELGAGDDVFRIPQKIKPEDGAGGYEYEAIIETGGDGVGENNRAFGYTRVEGEARILLVDGKGEARELEEALRGGGVANLDRIGPERFPASMAELQNYDAILLDDVGADCLTSGTGGQQQLLKDYVESHGGGLIMLGGDRSFGQGGWWHSPVEEALPVSMDVKLRKMRASMALVIVIDQSGSMSMTVPGGQTKISLANEAAVRVVEMLDEKDRVGVCYVDTMPKWCVRLQPASDGAKKGMMADIRSNLGGGGGIYVFTGITAAYDALDKVQAMIRHVILFSDASDSEQQEGCLEMAARERAKGRTLTVIGMGEETDQHGEFLKRLAKKGDGRILFVEDVRKLPAVFTSETLTASKSALVEAVFVPQLVGPATMTQGIEWSKAPPLRGYVTTTIKDRGEIILQSGVKDSPDDPILAKWQFGLGRSAAFTSDATARWAKDWMGWEGYRRFWPQLVRWVSRRRAATDHRVGVHFEQGKGKVTLDAFDAKGEPTNFLDLTARVSGPDGKPAIVRLTQRGSGRYEGEFPASASGGYFVTIADKETTIVGQAGSAVSYSPEYRAPEARSTLIEDLLKATGGRRLSVPQGLFEHTGRPATSPQEIWPWLLSLALALLLLDVGSRRIAIPELLGAVFSKVREKVLRHPPAAPLPPIERMERLKSAKKIAEEGEKRANAIIDAALPAPPTEGPGTPAVPPPEPPPPAQEGDYMQRLLDAKKKAKNE
jgi:uncharacterized membrane protein